MDQRTYSGPRIRSSQNDKEIEAIRQRIAELERLLELLKSFYRGNRQ